MRGNLPVKTEAPTPLVFMICLLLSMFWKKTKRSARAFWGTCVPPLKNTNLHGHPLFQKEVIQAKPWHFSVMWSGWFIDFRHIQRQKKQFYLSRLSCGERRFASANQPHAPLFLAPLLVDSMIQSANCINYDSKMSVQQELLIDTGSQSLILLPNNLNTYRHKNMVLRSFSPQRNWNLIWGVAEFSCVMTFHIISMTFLLTKKSHLLSKLRHLKINMEPKNHPLEIRKIICSPTKPPWIFHPWIFWLLKS